MKIRVAHPILDRLKIIIMLVIVLILLEKLAWYIDEGNQRGKVASIEKLVQTAVLPIGSTMYIWGGGWDAEDQAAGSTARQIGLDPQWERFANQQDAAYDFNNHRLERENGLDCSGYVGWVIYNTFESENEKDGYVITSTDMAKNYADRGWGTYIEDPRDFFVGDIVSMNGHVWISLGTCEDGSVLLVHSSPPGVSVCGTMLPDGAESMAVKLATEYMKKYHAKWQMVYPNRRVPHSYLENVTLMRWNSKTMSDAKSLQAFSAKDMMSLFFDVQEIK